MVKRLLKQAEEMEVNEAQNLVQRINTANDNLKQAYFVLFENLNALASGFPDLYNALKKDVKFPENDEIREFTDLYTALNQVLPMFMDVNYLKTYVGVKESPENIVETMGEEGQK